MSAPTFARSHAGRLPEQLHGSWGVNCQAPSHSESHPKEWFALGVKPRAEKAVARVLEGKGYEVFLPLYPRRHHYGRRWREFELVLFPGYVFCQFNVFARFPVVATPGVRQIVGAGQVPLPIEEREIQALRIAAGARLAFQPHPFLQTGDHVKITGGSLAGVEGIFVDFKNSLRLVLSITLLQRSVLVEIDRDLVAIGEGGPS